MTARRALVHEPLEVRERLGDREAASSRGEIGAEEGERQLVSGLRLSRERRDGFLETHAVMLLQLAGAADGIVDRVAVAGERDPILVDEGEHVDGWELGAAPGHADGQLCLLRDGVLVAADHLLGRITPTVGLWPASRADPLGDYLGALERTIELAPRIALPGHGEPIEDPAGRARELQEHHRVRLEEAVAALTAEPQTGYELSFALFGADLPAAGRRFAIAETLSHCERIVQEGAARRHEVDGAVTYTAA